MKKKYSYLQKFSWFFYDSHNQKYLIDYGPSQDFITELFNDTTFMNLPITVIGYSQGGYLAAKIPEVLKRVDHVIGMACAFKKTNFKLNTNVRYDQIHGTYDTIVDFKEAIKEYKKNKIISNKGVFIELKDSSHKLDDEFVVQLKKLLNLAN